MPIPGGTAGAHDDSMHQGSAKRDVADGVAGLDSGGDIVAPGDAILLSRDVANNIVLKERTSLGSVAYWNRIGAGDFLQYTMSGGSYSVVQLANMKDIASGIAALGAGGQLLAPGSDIELTRDGSENIEVVERTSGDIVYRWTRIGANDYECRINCGGVACKILNDSLIDAANGIAGLDANALLTPALLPPCLEEYNNHLGAVDNFTQTTTGGNGTAVTDVANHEMDLSTGLNAVGLSNFTSKGQYTLSAKPIVLNFLIDQIVNGVGNSRHTVFGLYNNFLAHDQVNRVLFEQYDDNTWKTVTDLAGSSTVTAISALSDGDLCTIVATSAKVMFFVNGSLVSTHTTNLPTGDMPFGGAVYAYNNSVTTARQISVDMMNIKRYM